MMRSVTAVGLIVSIGLAVAALAAISGPDAAKAQTPVMKVVPTSQSLDIQDGNFTTDIYAENVENLGAFEFTLSFNPDVIRLVGVEQGPFLGSTGRNIYCPRTIRYEPAPSGAGEAIRFGCNSSSSPDEVMLGPSGSGKVATVTFAPNAAGTSPLNLGLSGDPYGIADIWGNDIYIAAQGGRVEITGSGPTPTPRPDEPTPIPIETPSRALTPVATLVPGAMPWLTPRPGETPLARAVTDYRSGSSDPVAGRTDGRGGSSGSESTADGSPRAGTGPPEQETAWWPTALGGGLAAIGLVLLLSAAYLRPGYRTNRN